VDLECNERGKAANAADKQKQGKQQLKQLSDVRSCNANNEGKSVWVQRRPHKAAAQNEKEVRRPFVATLDVPIGCRWTTAAMLTSVGQTVQGQG
jgi:hypothetical protein